ncbi:MAG: penicillin-binding protein 1C [Sphingomonas sp.]
MADAGVSSCGTIARRRVAAWVAGGVGLLLLALLWITWPPAMPAPAAARAGFRPSEAWLYDRHGRLIERVRIDHRARRLGWVPLAGIAPALARAVVAGEDRRFFAHGGVDWIGVAGALRARAQGRRPRGASTITMQLAGFLAPELARPGTRGWVDKARQMRAAWGLERRWTKPQILEAYLNLAGWRGEAQGVGAASAALFGKPPSALTPPEARLMAALLPAPRAEPAAVARRACAAGGDCARYAALAYAALGPARAMAEDPGLAPHLARRLLTRAGARIGTTIDADTQRGAARALARQLALLGPGRARDGAVVVLDNRSGDVLAYVGGAGAGSTAGMVDGADAPRQAGSTLKPFLYAAAIERGWLTPASILDDSPVALDTANGLYVPQDYDRSFRGAVSVRSALAGSLNVPAVRALVLTGVEPFRDRLWDLGYAHLTEDGAYYGFSLALGSAEVTLLEQANAYRALANGGAWSPARLRPGDGRVLPRRVLSPQAAWLAADMMADPGARAVTFGLDSALRLPFWAAVKTGTSKAMRDNWCIGFSDRFTVAVWIGNLEGDAMRGVSGTSGAAPVWRETMLALHRGRPGLAPPPPPGVEARRIAFADGIEPPRTEWFLAGTGQAAVQPAPAAARRPRIASPVAGSVFALDPDIPIRHQRIRIATSGAAGGLRLRLDARDLGPAGDAPLVLAGPGRHRLALLDAQGRVVDRVLFAVR